MPIDITRARAITGWMDGKELRWLARTARSCQIIVEVGSYQGRSTRALADHCAGVVYAVDPWDGGYVNDDGTQAKWIDTQGAAARFRANLADHLATGRVVAIPGTLEQAMSRLEALGVAGRADLVFIDADHRYEPVMADIVLADRLVRPGGIVAGHDFGHPTWPGVKRAVDECFGADVQLCRMIWWAQTAGPAPEPLPLPVPVAPAPIEPVPAEPVSPPSQPNKPPKPEKPPKAKADKIK